MHKAMILLVTAALVFFAAPFAQKSVYAGAAEDVKEGAEKIVEGGKEKVKDTVDKAKEELEKTKETFWDKVNPFIALPATLLVGLIMGFFLGYRGGKSKDKKKK